MAKFMKLCQKYFGCSDYYEVLGINNKASSAEIKKAYHRLSLLYHPDRVDEKEKLVATEKFKVISKIHAVLQDREKRKTYDSFGEYDGDDDDDNFNWQDYWNSIFKEITLQDIDKYKNEYIGSETEKRDLKKAYIAAKGKMAEIISMVPFSDCDSEERFIKIVREMVDNGEVEEEYKCFFNEPQKKKEARRRKWEKEKKLAEETDAKDLEKEILERREKRKNDFADLMSNIEAKYSKKSVKRKSITDGSTPKPKRQSTRGKKTE